MTATQFAVIVGCTTEQAVAQYTRNVVALRAMAAKAVVTGKKVNGYTAESLLAKAEKMAMNTI